MDKEEIEVKDLLFFAKTGENTVRQIVLKDNVIKNVIINIICDSEKYIQKELIATFDEKVKEDE